MEIGYSSDNIGKKGHDFVIVDGVRYACSEKLQKKLSYCSNAKEYSEMMESVAYQVFDARTLENDDLLKLV